MNNVEWLSAKLGVKSQQYEASTGGTPSQDFRDRCGAYATFGSDAVKTMADTLMFPDCQLYSDNLEKQLSELMLVWCKADKIKLRSEDHTLLVLSRLIARLVLWMYNHDRDDTLLKRAGKLRMVGIELTVNNYQVNWKKYEDRMFEELDRWYTEIDFKVGEYRDAMSEDKIADYLQCKIVLA